MPTTAGLRSAARARPALGPLLAVGFAGAFVLLAGDSSFARPAFISAIDAAPSPRPRPIYIPYNETLATSLAILCGAAYCSAPVIQDWSCTKCAGSLVADFKVVGVVNDNASDIHGYIGYFPPDRVNRKVSVVVVFRGTSSVLDWLEDFHVFEVEWMQQVQQGLWVHQGFLDGYLSVDAQVQETLNSTFALFPGYEVDLIVTGHSLGAALAEICAIHLYYTDSIRARITGKPQLVNFGQPRAGDANFAQWAEHQMLSYYRVVHWRDIVPHVPVTFVGPQGFLHGGTEVWYSEENQFHIVCDMGEDYQCSDSLIDLSVADHIHYMFIAMDGSICAT